jgi:hypothetical protein
MSAIGKLWAGQVFGTNTGNLFVEFVSDVGDQLKGVLRFMDQRFGLVLYDIEFEVVDTGARGLRNKSICLGRT